MTTLEWLDGPAAMTSVQWMDRVRSAGKKLCGRCNGAGMIVQFAHWKGGVCFGCNGQGVVKK